MELTEVQKEADSAGKKAIYFGVAALMFAVLFGWMLAQLNGGGPETQPVVVASEDIAPLSGLKETQLKVVPWPSAAIPKGAFTTIKEILDQKQITVNGLLVGEPILADRLSTQDHGLGMSLLVKPDFRAFVVQILDSVAVAELIHPGAHVDVLATLTSNRTQEIATHVLLQNVEVMAVGDSIDVEAAKPRTDKAGTVSEDRGRMERHRVVTLSVALGDIEALTLATRQGKIDLALRSKDDARIVVSSGTTLEQIISDRRKAPPVSAPVEVLAPPAETHSSMPSKSHDKPAKHHHDAQDSGPSIYKVRH